MGKMKPKKKPARPMTKAQAKGKPKKKVVRPVPPTSGYSGETSPEIGGVMPAGNSQEGSGA